MARKENPKYVVKNRKIYALIFENEQAFYVGSTSMERIYLAYNYHFMERNPLTKSLFHKYKEENQRPKMFLLEEIEGTEPNAFERCMIWSKYFQANGYRILSGSKMEELVSQLDESALREFQKIENIPMKNLCADDKNLFPAFRARKNGEQKGNAKGSSDIVRCEVRMRRKEYEIYKKKADELGKSMTDYIMEHLRNGGVIQLDGTWIELYIKKIAGFQHSLAGIISTILLSKEYFPADLERMYELSQAVMETNKEVINEISRLYRKLRYMKTGRNLK